MPSLSGDLQADLDHRLLEEGAVLGGGDGLGVGADHLRRAGHADEPTFEQLHGDVQTGLAAEGRQYGVGLLPFDDRRQHLPGERFHVGGVGEVGVGHDRGGIRIGEDHAVALFAQHAACLGARVVELAGLADDDGTGADDQDRVEIGAFGHQRAPFPPLWRAIISSNWSNR